VAQPNRGRVSVPAQAASSGSHNQAPGSAGGIDFNPAFSKIPLSQLGSIPVRVSAVPSKTVPWQSRIPSLHG
jgi:hypothetical protein